MSSKRNGGAHGAAKKRNKAYRPRSGPVTGGATVLANRIENDERVERVLSQRYCDEQRNEIASAYWLAFHQLKMEQATEEAWATLAVTLNKAMLLCETGFGEDNTPAMRAALDGMFRARLRGDQRGSFRLDGAGLAAVSDALVVHDAQMELATYRDIRRVEEMLEMRVAAGNHYRAEPAH